MTTPTQDEFRALARSAPWLFTTLHFTHHPGNGGWGALDPTMAWLTRPGHLVVRDARGTHTVTEPVLPEGIGTPQWRPDGLVGRRPDQFVGAYPIGPDDPMWQSYVWVAMLHPVELSTGTVLTDLATTERLGRETWWATAVAVDGYEPRCSCCALLHGEVSDRLEYGDGFVPRPYPDAWLVGLDRATGIVVALEPINGSDSDFQGFTNEIHGAALTGSPV